MVGLAVGNLLQPGAGLHIDPAHLDDKAVAGYVTSAKSLTVVDFLLKMIPANMVGAVAQGDLLPVLVMAALFGFALCQIGERGQRLVVVIDDFTHALFGVVRIVMYVAPWRDDVYDRQVRLWHARQRQALGERLSDLDPLRAPRLWLDRGPVRPAGVEDHPLFQVSATSGEAIIPRSIAKLERIGCSEETVGLVLPTGFSFNTDGTAIYMTLAVLFIAQATDIHLTIGQQLTMLFVILFTSKGAAGVAGAGFVALAATLPAVGIVPVGGLALLLGVERFMSEIRAVHQPL